MTPRMKRISRMVCLKRAGETTPPRSTASLRGPVTGMPSMQRVSARWRSVDSCTIMPVRRSDDPDGMLISGMGSTRPPTPCSVAAARCETTDPGGASNTEAIRERRQLMGTPTGPYKLTSTRSQMPRWTSRARVCGWMPTSVACRPVINACWRASNGAARSMAVAMVPPRVGKAGEAGEPSSSPSHYNPPVTPSRDRVLPSLTHTRCEPLTGDSLGWGWVSTGRNRDR